MSTEFCLQLIVALGAIVLVWVRLERRLTRIEDRVRERYRDKQAVTDRFESIERWLPTKKRE
jgi:hypothetical protein